MKNIKKFENFEGHMADEEADQMAKDQIYADREAQDAADAQEFGGEDIISRFDQEFGENKPSEQEFAEFYHKLRTEGIDGIEIFDTLKDAGRVYGSEESQEDEEHEEEDFGYAAHDGSFGEDDSEIEEGKEDAQYEGLKKFSDFK